MPPPAHDKSSLRAHFRSVRHQIGEEQRRRHDGAINAEIEEFCEVRRPARVAAYLAFDGEPDISTALLRLRGLGVEIYLPVINSGAGRGELHFRRWSADVGNAPTGELRRNDFGIQEPTGGEHCAVADLDLMLIPLVAWDRRGGRLGMGAGFFDRALAGVTDAGKPLRIGIAYRAQRADSVPMTAEDVRLHGVITEKGLFTFGD